MPLFQNSNIFEHICHSCHKGKPGPFIQCYSVLAGQNRTGQYFCMYQHAILCNLSKRTGVLRKPFLYLYCFPFALVHCLCIGALLNWCSYNWSLVIGILVYFRKQLVDLDTSVHNGHLQLFLGRKFNFHQQITATQTQNTNTESKHRTQTQNTNTEHKHKTRECITGICCFSLEGSSTILSPFTLLGN